MLARARLNWLNLAWQLPILYGLMDNKIIKITIMSCTDESKIKITLHNTITPMKAMNITKKIFNSWRDMKGKMSEADAVHYQ